MSDVTSPERIWATPYDAGIDSGTYCNAETRPTAPNHDAWCYTRADLHAALQAENERLRLRMEKLEMALEDIADGMGEDDMIEVGRFAPHVARAALK